jgi:RHS repeat-associated protein
LALWGGVGQQRLSWERWAHSRTTAGNQWFGRGHNWRHNYQWEIAPAGVTANGQPQLSINYPNGAVWTFTQLNATQWQSAYACPDRLAQDGDAFTLQRANGWQYHIVRHAASGLEYYLVEAFTDAQGNTYVLAYDANQQLIRVTEPAGRWLAIQYGTVTMEQGAEHTPVVITVIANVTASDGRQVTYNYAAYTDTALPYTYQVLASVNYPEGAVASYTYLLTQPGTRPLVARWDDPHYRLPLPCSRTVYNLATNAPWGSVLQQINDQTGEVILTVGGSNTNNPVATYPRRGTNQFGMAGGQELSETDGLGHQTQYGYDTTGFQNVTTDPLGRTTQRVNSAFGNPLQVTHPDSSVEAWERDALDLPVQYTDTLGRVTTYTRDALHRVTQSDYPDASVETFTYNDFGQVTRRVLRNSGVVQATYDTAGRMTSQTDPEGAVTSYDYDALDRLVALTDPRSNVTQFAYDLAGRLTQVIYADGSSRSMSYDTYGNLVYEVNELGKVRSFTYDIFRRLASVTDPLGHLTQVQHASNDLMKDPLTRVFPSGRTVTFAYDLALNLAAQTLGGATATYAYDQADELVTATDPLNRATQFTYDVRGRLASSADPLARATQRTYDTAGNLLTVETPDGEVTTNVYDVMNRVSSTTNPNGEQTTFAYDAIGNLMSVTDAKSHTTQYTYDLNRRRTASIYPDASQETFAYDGNGNLVTASNRAGATLTQVFDQRNRLVSSTWDDATPAVSRTYDAAGRLLTLVNANSALTYVYDDADRLVSETQELATALLGDHAGPRTVSYAYDADGNRTSLTYPSGRVIEQSFDDRNQLTAITPAGLAPSASYGYDLAGERTALGLANGTTAGYTYDAASQLTQLQHALGATVFAQETYGYDLMSRRTFTKRLGGLGDVYAYDAIGQVTQTLYAATNPDTTPSNPAETVGYAYDAAGNRTTLTDNGGTTTYAVNALNQYTQVSGFSPSASYDGNGNLAGLDNEHYTYDAQNRLVAATVGTNTVQCWYDARNRCVARSVNDAITALFSDGWSLIEELAASGNVTGYVHGPRLDELVAKLTADNTVYYHADVLGNVAYLTDESGAVVEQYTYDIFGQPTILDGSGQPLAASAYGNRFLFTGREWLAELGLYDYRNRMYSPTLGRFLQTDPIGFLAGDANIYRYCGNNAANVKDPLGLDGTVCEEDITGGEEENIDWDKLDPDWAERNRADAQYFRDLNGPTIIGRLWNGTKWVVGGVWDGTKWVAGSVWDGTKWVGETVTHWATTHLTDVADFAKNKLYNPDLGVGLRITPDISIEPVVSIPNGPEGVGGSTSPGLTVKGKN